jgi:hypothetical protein
MQHNRLARVQLRPFDLLVFVLGVMAIGVSIYFTTSVRGGVPEVEVRSPAGVWLYPLKNDLLLPPVGPEGTCVIAIEARTVRVLSSDCPKMICLQTGRISLPGQWIGCLPHQVFIRILGGREEGAMDAVAY